MTVPEAKLTPAEFDAEAKLALSLARTLMFLDVRRLEAMLSWIDRTHASGPIIDPTLYREGLDKLSELEDFLRATLVYRKALERLTYDPGYSRTRI